MKIFNFLFIAAISFFLFSCNSSTSKDNNLPTASTGTDNVENQNSTIEEDSKAEWETEDFLSNSDEFEKNLSNKAKRGDAEALKDLGMHFLEPYRLGSKLKGNEELAISLLLQASNKMTQKLKLFYQGYILAIMEAETIKIYTKAKSGLKNQLKMET